MRRHHGGLTMVGALALALGSTACTSDSGDAATNALANRAYIVSLDSDELTVIDLSRLEIIARVSTNGVANHMAEVNADFTKVYVDSSHSNETVVVDEGHLVVGPPDVPHGFINTGQGELRTT